MDYGLIGERLSHSYSKQIHEQLGDYSYQIMSLAPGEVQDFLLKRQFKGINVTIPYKKTVIPFCDTVSPVAERIGSVNTITVDDKGKLHGDNTDYYGFSYMAEKAGISFKNKKVLVLGSGGTGRTVEAVADDCDAAEIIIVSRTGKVNYDNVYEESDADIIVNATPVGMYPETGEIPIDLNRFPKCSGLLDVTYNPLFSRLLLEAKRLEIPYSNGLTMLAAQAKRSADLFFGEEIVPKKSIDEIVKELTERFTNIVLIGMPGSGKTTVGKLIAEKTNKMFADTDAVIEEQERLSIPKIFESFGEAYFRNLEAAVIAKLGKEKGQVIATGGGAVLRHENYLNLKQNGFIIFIERELHCLASQGRPLSASREAVEELYKDRLPLYLEYCDAEISSDKTAQITAQKALEVFNENINC